MAEMIEVKHKDRLDSEPAVTSREAFDKVWAAKGFVEIGPDGQPAKALDAMTIPELQAYAEARGVQIPSNATKKDDIVAFLQKPTDSQEG